MGVPFQARVTRSDIGSLIFEPATVAEALTGYPMYWCVSSQFCYTGIAEALASKGWGSRALPLLVLKQICQHRIGRRAILEALLSRKDPTGRMAVFGLLVGAFRRGFKALEVAHGDALPQAVDPKL